MHHPPEVRFLVDRSPWPLRLTLLIGILALVQTCQFSWLNGTASWQMVLVAVSLLVALMWAGLSARRQTKSTLHWDGLQWRWSGFAEGTCLLELHLDFQALVLVSLHRPAARPVWLWLQRSHGPLQWLALRRAVVHTTSPERAHRSEKSAQARHAAIP